LSTLRGVGPRMRHLVSLVVWSLVFFRELLARLALHLRVVSLLCRFPREFIFLPTALDQRLSTNGSRPTALDQRRSTNGFRLRFPTRASLAGRRWE
jgi:hypothetical protein